MDTKKQPLDQKCEKGNLALVRIAEKDENARVILNIQRKVVECGS